jgi:hypothetical protein
MFALLILREWKKLSMGALSWLLPFRLFVKKAVCDILFTPLKNFHNPSLSYTPPHPKMICHSVQAERDTESSIINSFLDTGLRRYDD